MATLLDTYDEDLKLDPRPHHTVLCTEPLLCRSEFVRIRRGVEESYAALVARLAEDGHLSGPADAPPSPDVTFTLYDLRREKAAPLPSDIEGVKVSVELMDAGAGGDAGEPRR